MRPLAALFFFVLSLSCASAATFETGTISGWPAVRISGPIVSGDDKTFQSLLSADQKNLIVELNSPGGAVFPALAIGRVIHDRGNWTLVARGEACASACAMIWLGGKTRFAHPNGSVGFHAVFDKDSMQITGNGNAVVGAYYDHLGLSQDAIFWMASAPPNGMFWLNHDLAEKYRIAYTVAKDDDAIIIDPTQAPSVGIPMNPKAPNVAFVPLNRDAVRDPVPARKAPAETAPPYVPPQATHEVELNEAQRAALTRLAAQFRKRLAEAGPGGLIVSIQTCYGAVRLSYDRSAAEYCAALDEMTWKIGQRIAQQNGENPPPFTSADNVRSRIGAIAALIGYGSNLLDVATEMAERAQVIVDAENSGQIPVTEPTPVVRRRPRVVSPRFMAGCAPFNPLAALLVGATPNPACR